MRADRLNACSIAARRRTRFSMFSARTSTCSKARSRWCEPTFYEPPEGAPFDLACHAVRWGSADWFLIVLGDPVQDFSDGGGFEEYVENVCGSEIENVESTYIRNPYWVIVAGRRSAIAARDVRRIVGWRKKAPKNLGEIFTYDRLVDCAKRKANDWIHIKPLPAEALLESEAPPPASYGVDRDAGFMAKEMEFWFGEVHDEDTPDHKGDFEPARQRMEFDSIYWCKAQITSVAWEGNRLELEFWNLESSFAEGRYERMRATFHDVVSSVRRVGEARGEVPFRSWCGIQRKEVWIASPRSIWATATKERSSSCAARPFWTAAISMWIEKSPPTGSKRAVSGSSRTSRLCARRPPSMLRRDRSCVHSDPLRFTTRSGALSPRRYWKSRSKLLNWRIWSSSGIRTATPTAGCRLRGDGSNYRPSPRAGCSP